MLKKTIIIITFSILLFGCEDPAPKDYIQSTIVEALLVVDKPIQNIRITKTQPLTEHYDYNNAIISNAKVFIYEGEQEFELAFRHSEVRGQSGYYFPDTNYLVKRNTTYRLKIILPDGRNVTGTTTTPDSISWVRKVPSFVQYPLDTINLPPDPNLIVEWTRANIGNAFYILTATCLDTLEYGKYLPEPTDEPNRRVYPESRHERSYRELTSTTMSMLTRFPIPWRAFRWFGPFNVKVYVPDKNYELWFLYFWMTGNLDEKANSVEACAGFFGSAFMIADDFFVLKNQP
jgi:hypothetical protein